MIVPARSLDLDPGFTRELPWNVYISSDQARAKVKITRDANIFRCPSCSFEIPGFRDSFLQPRDLISRARYLHHVCARVYIAYRVSDRIAFLSCNRRAAPYFFFFFFLHDVTRVDNFHAGGEEGEAKEKKEKKEITARKSAVLLPTRIRVAQTHQITVPSDGRVPLTFRPRRLSSYWRLFFLFVPAARGGTLFLAPAFSRRFPRVYSTRRKSHLPTEGPTPEGLYNDTRVIDTFFTMRLGWLY